MALNGLVRAIVKEKSPSFFEIALNFVYFVLDNGYFMWYNISIQEKVPFLDVTSTR